MARSSRKVSFHDLLPRAAAMGAEVGAGLSQRQKSIPPKYFYDEHGCALFAEICRLDEYYPTRAELAIMRAHSNAMARLLGAHCALIEDGCGNSEKTRLLLTALKPDVFVPIDIAREQLMASCDALAPQFPRMTIVALRADFAHPVAVPDAALRAARRRILYFPGSTIGNFAPDEALAFLARWKLQLGEQGGALIGVDLKKDSAVLDAAYNDARGVTAQFNLNILSHVNRELGADFDLAAFRHRAFYDAARSRIEMHLESLKAQRVTIAGNAFDFARGETIRTEDSYKYSIGEFQELARNAGFEPQQHWIDDGGLFSVHYLAAR